MGASFSRERRIVKTDDFSSVFRLKPKNRTAHFILYARKSVLPHARLGLVVAKRFAPRAVTRNTIKRVCREVFRKTELSAMDCIVRLSGLVMVRGEPAASVNLKRQLRQELEQLFASQTTDGKSG
ncbi:MAG: ribonuclease P protein component [Betaproteobacteria bacterium]|nr:ribonuclease P protein component [Betaproteobacteria bacterium]